MKRLSLVVALALVIALGAGINLRDAGPASAVDQPFTNTVDVGLSSTSVGDSPDLQVALVLDTTCGVPDCTTTPTNPFFDIAITTYSSGVTGSPGALTGSGIESSANCAIADVTKPCLLPAEINYGAKVGSNFFQINTNQGLNALTNNIDPAGTSGAPPQCLKKFTVGDPPGISTSQLSQTFDILNGNILTTGTVSGKDDTDPDPLPQTQADADANGIPDGADQMPDYIATLLGSSSALLKGRGYGIAKIVPSVAHVDVNFLTLDLTIFSQGYAAVTTLGNTDTSYEPQGSQTSITCTPFISTTTTFGTSVTNADRCTAVGVPSAACTTATNFGAGATETGKGGDRTRLISGTNGVTINYAFVLSAQEDYDDDGAPINLDRCSTVAQGSVALAKTDSDGDGIGDDCETAGGTPSGSADNCAAASSCATDSATAPYPTSQVVCTAGQIGEGSPNPRGRAVWHASGCTQTAPTDQDVDGDGIHNFADTCPYNANRTQTDSDADGVANVCDTNLGSVHVGGAGAATTRDARSGGGQGLAAGIDFPTCNVATTCHISAQGTRAGNEGATGDRLWNDPIVLGTAEGNPIGGSAPFDALADATPPVVVAITDSNDDGFPDAFAGGAGLAAVNDINSDSDADGCSDNYEAKGGCQGNASDPDVNGDGLLDGGQDLDPVNGKRDWIDDATGCSAVGVPAGCVAADVVAGAIPHSSGTSPNGQGSPDSDGDGCSNRREASLQAPGTVQTGGLRDALNPYDFADHFTANNPSPAPRNKVVQGGDALAANFYGGNAASAPNLANTNGTTYGGSGASVIAPGDSNNDGISNGAEYDRGAAGAISKGGNGAMGGSPNDALVTNNQAGGANGPVNCNGS